MYLKQNMENRNKFLIWGIVLLALILSSVFFLYLMNSKDSLEETNTSDDWKVWDEKIDFFIETKTLNDFGWSAFLEKTWKVISQEDISITAQANWKISKISVVKLKKFLPTIFNSIKNIQFLI